ncbi:MAG: Phosphohydrolase [Firmicutes bacterium]|nr:Phosphohydrolase [Bacillota bacterium]MDI6705049.1 HD domain-containing protein [Bacillota bacterium]
MDRLRMEKQIAFIEEIDRVKQIYRRTILMDGSRNENDAEHSWHLAVMAVLLSEYAGEEIDLLKVVKMVLIHDIVEIDAGDTYCYDEVGCLDKRDREVRAADRIFNILPDDQAREFRELWEEFEECNTPEAKFAASLDRFQPLLHNYKTRGLSWKKHGITKGRVIERNSLISEGAPDLWEYARDIIEKAVDNQFLRE